MVSKHYYEVSVFNEKFSSLEDAKWNVKITFTPKESLKYLRNEKIYHYIGDKLHSVTPIKVDDAGKVSFGRTVLIYV